MPFRIHAVEPLGAVLCITLEAPAGFRFAAGQYVSIRHPAGAIPMSVASAPDRLPWLVLHYRSTPGVPEARWMDELVERGTDLDVDGPFGAVAYAAPPAVPVLIVAGGTGASQATSLVEYFESASEPPPTTLLWSVSAPVDLYNDAYFDRTARGGWFSYRAYIDDPRGRNRLLPKLAEPAELGVHRKHGDVVLAGPPGFVHGAVERLAAAGVARSRLRSDVFAYAPLEADSP